MSESEQPPSTAPDAATGPSPSQSAPVEAIISPPPPTTVAEPSSSVAASSSSAAESVDKSAVVSEQAAAVEPIAASVADASNVENASPAVVPAACPEPASEPQQAEPSLTSELSSEVEASPAPASSPPVENLLVDSPVTVASAPDQSESSPQEEAMESKAASSPPADAAAVAAEPVPVAVAEALPAAEASPSAPAASLAPAPAPSKRSPSPSPPPSSSPPAAAAAPSASPPPSSSNSFFRSIMTAFASLKESSSRSKDSENKDPAQASPAAAAAASSPQPPLVPGQPTAAQLALCSQAESALAWGVQQDVIHSALSPSVRSVADFSALQMAETEAVQRWIVEMRTAVEWSIPEHHALLERLWASYACVLQPPSNTGAAQSPLSMRAPPFPGPISQSWKLLGFQGTNPTTDFRGVGLLSLQVLVYLGEHHRELVHVLMSLQNADLLQPREYPLACAGINLVCAVINMLEMDAPAASSASRNNNSNATSASVSSLSSSGSNFSANPANNSVAPGLHNGAGSRSAAKAELQGPAGKFLNQLSATVSEVTRKIKDKLEDAASSDSAATATQASSAASTAADAEATAAAAAAVAAAGCSVRLDPLEDQLNGLLARLGKNRLFRLFVRNKSQIPAPLTEEEAAAAALVSPSVRRAAAAGRSPQPAVPAVPFRPASGEQLAAIHSIGELLAVLFPLLDDLWVDENANYFGSCAPCASECSAVTAACVGRERLCLTSLVCALCLPRCIVRLNRFQSHPAFSDDSRGQRVGAQPWFVRRAVRRVEEGYQRRETTPKRDASGGAQTDGRDGTGARIAATTASLAAHFADCSTSRRAPCSSLCSRGSSRHSDFSDRRRIGVARR